MMDAMVCVTQIRFDLLQKLLWGEDDENVKRGACKVKVDSGLQSPDWKVLQTNYVLDVISLAPQTYTATWHKGLRSRLTINSRLIT